MKIKNLSIVMLCFFMLGVTDKIEKILCGPNIKTKFQTTRYT